MKELVVVFGPPAVGKMTVGQEIAERTGFKLFHNHCSAELANIFFPFGTPSFGRLNTRLRAAVFEEVVESDLPGLVFTYVWAFELGSEKAYVDDIVAKFASRGARASFVELEARLDVRLERNRHESRLLAKPSKRDVAKSEELLLRHCQEHRFNTTEEEPFYYPDRHLKLETSALAATEAAERICRHFGFDEALGG